MIINISNITSTARFKRYDFGALAGIAAQSGFTSRLDEYYFIRCARDAFLADITCDKTVRGVCVCRNLLIPDSCEVETICIDEGFRGIGLGRKLLSHSLRNMRALRLTAAFVWIDERNTAGAGFFGHIGFKPDGKRRKSLVADDGEELRFRIDI